MKAHKPNQTNLISFLYSLNHPLSHTHSEYHFFFFPLTKPWKRQRNPPMLTRNSPPKEGVSGTEVTLMSIIIIITITTTTIIIITISTIIISYYNTQLNLVSATTTTTRTSIRDTTLHFFLYLLLYLFSNFLWLHPFLKTTPSNQKPIFTTILHANSIALPPQITSSLNQHLLLVSNIVPSLSNLPFSLHSSFVNSQHKNLFFRPVSLVFLKKKYQIFFIFSHKRKKKLHHGNTMKKPFLAVYFACCVCIFKAFHLGL